MDAQAGLLTELAVDVGCCLGAQWALLIRAPVCDPLPWQAQGSQIPYMAASFPVMNILMVVGESHMAFLT